MANSTLVSFWQLQDIFDATGNETCSTVHLSDREYLKLSV